MVSPRVPRHLPQRLTLAFAAFALAACTADGGDAVASTPQLATSGPETAGVVSAADPRAAEAGAEMLRKGGSATDAAIATMLALGVIEPQSSGIGGGGFLVTGDKAGAVATFDGRETAPMAAGPDWFLDAAGKPRGFMDAVRSGLSVGVPGNLRLAAKAHERGGKLPWKTLFDPAIALAGNGFAITERMHGFLGDAKDRAAASPSGQKLFYDADGNPLPVGTVVKNPELAATLKKIAAQGPDAFYTGDNALAIATKVSAATPGPRGMVTGDIEHYTAREREPVCGHYRTYRICGMGPPSSGATTVIAILDQLEGFDMTALGKDSPVAWHLFAESQRLAFADRELYLGDSDFIQVPVAGLVDEAYLRQRGALISPDHTMAGATAGTPPAAASLSWADGDEPEEHGTTHFVAIDQWGDAASYTSTVEGSFGSGLMVGGYYLNNELTDFSFSPDMNGRPVANRVEPGKRPRSSMAPTLVYDKDGKLVLAIGAAGGATIPVQVAKALVGWIDWHLSAQDAIALPMLYSPGDAITLEPGSPLEAMVPALTALGHASIAERPMPLKANAVERTAAGWRGAADPRSEGGSVKQ
ncbi:MAG: gamma-glutamyltransferase [Candidatus Andeanibacterium colombiense]|uniref:Glutathione hydrolase proenzyme n=1 Tax=Candidatus Andeanibacterium colombiense TaxID=3121345 RepID=A0AAJ5X7H2_9SPHN|nr:MAG: gamma-glutamyltransferase [Sphingomonadaceae bacterium]